MLITIEGIDGSGKGTLAENLTKAIRGRNREAVSLSFPQYGQNPFADEVGRYLNHHLDLMGDDSIRYAAILYASDRATAKEKIQGLLNAGVIVVCDRYVESNLAHQVARAPQVQRDSLAQWISDIEYVGFGMPKPDITFLLDIDVTTARQRIARKQARSYTDLAEDAHESNSDYLTETRDLYLRLARGDTATWRVLPAREASQETTPTQMVGICMSHLENGLQGAQPWKQQP